jgi:hypothetical protein
MKHQIGVAVMAQTVHFLTSWAKILTWKEI